MNSLLSLPVLAGMGGASASVTMIVYVGVLFFIFYFILIRPQKKKEKERSLIIASVEKGDSILTTSGFYGVVIDVMEEIVIVEFGNNKNCRIPMKKEAIVEVEKEGEDK